QPGSASIPCAPASTICWCAIIPIPRSRHSAGSWWNNGTVTVSVRTLMAGLMAPLLLSAPALAFDQAELDAFLAEGECFGCDLTEADLAGAQLADSYLTYSDLSGADLTGADLSESYIRFAVLEGTDLTGANLEQSNMWDARMRGAIFAGANLAGGSIQGATLSNADFTGATLTGINGVNAN